MTLEFIVYDTSWMGYYTGKILSTFDSKFHFGIYCLFLYVVKIDLAGRWGGIISIFWVLQMRYVTVNSKMKFSVEQIICYLNRPSGDGQTYGWQTDRTQTYGWWTDCQTIGRWTDLRVMDRLYTNVTHLSKLTPFFYRLTGDGQTVDKRHSFLKIDTFLLP